MRHYCAFFVCILVLSPLAYADTNTIIDKILAEDHISYANAAWLACNAGELVPDTASTADAVTIGRNQGWNIPSDAEANPATMGDFSFMLMSALKLKGGVLYSLSSGSRYALRELQYLKAVPTPSWPTKTLSGEEALRILQKALDIKEKQR